ncbi:MAG TPA: Crp/Fnr family transcriptional regulator [Acidimicrobiales bacterium]|nr:Crp/Fnr family transcriptional regulator [Acidimicrobiales bacterium]
MTDAEASSLQSRSRRRSYSRGSVLFRQGDIGDEIFILRAGRVKVCARRASREVILAVLDAGALLGELSSVDGSARSATVIALEDVEVDVTTHGEFNELLEEHPRVATELLRLVAGRLRDASLRQLEFGTMDTLGRLCASLTELAARYGHESGGATEITPPFHQGELASWSGMSREAVVKGFRQLRGLGWLSIEGQTLILHDPAAIHRRAHSR